MKKLHVTIKMVMEVPDEWVLEEVDDGISVVNIGDGKYMDLAAEPSLKTRTAPGRTTTMMRSPTIYSTCVAVKKQPTCSQKSNLPRENKYVFCAAADSVDTDAS